MAGKRDSDLNLKNRFISKETAQCYAIQGKYQKVVGVLKRHEDNDEDYDLSSLLLLMDAYIRLGREMKASTYEHLFREIVIGDPIPQSIALETLSNAYTKTGNTNYIKVLIARNLLSELYGLKKMTDREKFIALLYNLRECASTVRKLIKRGSPESDLERLAEYLQKREEDDDDEDFLNELMSSTDTNETKMRLLTIAIDYGQEYMETMFYTLMEMPDIVSPKRASDLAFCANAIGYQYCAANDYFKSIQWRRNGIKLMEEQFGHRASLYNMFGDLHHNNGVAFLHLKRYREALTAFEKAIEIYEEATDYSNEIMRKWDLEQSRNHLPIINKHL